MIAVDVENVKAASNVADYKSVAAMIGLKHSFAGGFQNISGLWVGNLLHQGSVFYEKASETFILSLGFHSFAGLGWELQVFPEQPGYFQLSDHEMSENECRAKLQFFTTHELWTPVSPMDSEEYSGVPTEICF